MAAFRAGAAAPAAAPAFGAAPAAAPGFGAAPAAAPGFGAAPAAAPGFGAAPAAAPAAAPGFGAAPAPAAAPGFGAAPAAPAAAPGFGAAPAAAPGFGAAPAAAPAAAPGFGAAPAAVPGAAPAFGAAPAAAPAAPAFGKAPAAPGFGAAPAAPAAAPAFGATPAAAPGFGAAPAAAPAGFAAAPGVAGGAAGSPIGTQLPNRAPDTQLPSGPTDTISHLSFSPKGCQKTMLSCTSWDMTVRVWDLAAAAGGTVQATPLTMQKGTAPILSSALTADGRVFYGGCDNAVHMLNLAAAGSAPQQVAAHTAPVSCVRWIESSQMLITGGWDGNLNIWDVRQPTGQPAKQVPVGGPIVGMSVNSLPTIAVLSSRKIHLFNTQTMAPAGDSEPNQFIKIALRDVAGLEDNTGLVAVGNDGRLAYHSLVNNPQNQSFCFKAHTKEVATPQKYSDMYPINTVTVAKHTAITGGSDGAIRLWNLKTKGRIHEYNQTAAPIPVSAGAIDASHNLYAYSLCYDYSLGQGYYNPQGPVGVYVKNVGSQIK